MRRRPAINPDERKAWLKKLYDDGRRDAMQNRPSQAGALPGPEDRDAYLAGYEAGYMAGNHEAGRKRRRAGSGGSPSISKDD